MTLLVLVDATQEHLVNALHVHTEKEHSKTLKEWVRQYRTQHHSEDVANARKLWTVRVEREICVCEEVKA